MSERNAPSRAISVGGGIVAIAGLAVALPLYARAFTQVDWALTVAGSIAIAFVAHNALPVRGLRMRRTGFSADAIFLDELTKAGFDRPVAQAFAVLLPIQAVGVMGDARTYESVIALRAVETDDFMTADWSHLPYELLAKVSTRIINQVAGVNRVVYDVSSKPPATIEWE